MRTIRYKGRYATQILQVPANKGLHWRVRDVYARTFEEAIALKRSIGGDIQFWDGEHWRGPAASYMIVSDVRTFYHGNSFRLAAFHYVLAVWLCKQCAEFRTWSDDGNEYDVFRSFTKPPLREVVDTYPNLFRVVSPDGVILWQHTDLTLSYVFMEDAQGELQVSPDNGDNWFRAGTMFSHYEPIERGRFVLHSIQGDGWRTIGQLHTLDECMMTPIPYDYVCLNVGRNLWLQFDGNIHNHPTSTEIATHV